MCYIYRMKSAYIWGIAVIFLLIPSASRAGVTSEQADTLRASADTLKAVVGDTTEVPAKSPAGAMLRSLAVPGWGQFYNGKYMQGALILGLETFFAAGAFVEHRNFVREGRSWSSPHRERRNNFLIWLAGPVLFSMADAYVAAHLYRFDEDFKKLE